MRSRDLLDANVCWFWYPALMRRRSNGVTGPDESASPFRSAALLLYSYRRNNFALSQFNGYHPSPDPPHLGQVTSSWIFLPLPSPGHVVFPDYRSPPGSWATTMGVCCSRCPSQRSSRRPRSSFLTFCFLSTIEFQPQRPFLGVRLDRDFRKTSIPDFVEEPEQSP